MYANSAAGEVAYRCFRLPLFNVEILINLDITCQVNDSAFLQLMGPGGKSG
jgi:hypothetical protein